MPKHARRLLSLMLALVLLLSTVSTAAALYEDVPQPTTYEEVFDRIMALQEKYPEGTPWTNETRHYTWNGGRIMGNVNSGDGCVAFGFEASDAAFGTLPARVYENFSYDAVRVGDLLRTDGGTHMVIVLQKTAGGVIVAEGNISINGSGGIAHWGRAMSVAEVEAANLLITRYPEGFVPADDPDADGVVSSGKVGNLTWTITKSGTLTISGQGAIPDYNAGEAPWAKETFNNIVIEDGVSAIGDFSFYQSSAISTTISGTVQSIGASAYRGSKLVAVSTPSSVKTIGESAFRECDNLVATDFAEGLEVIENNAFRSCTSLKATYFPSTIKKAGAGAFWECNEMTSAVFAPSNNVVEIGDDLFGKCWYLTDVVLPEKANCISSGMFAGCLTLPTLDIPAGVAEIKSVGTASGAPFANCNMLATINFGGTRAQWESIGGPKALELSNLTNTTVNCSDDNKEPENPGPTDPTDPVDPTPPTHTQDNCPNKVNLTPDQTCEVCGAQGTKVVDPEEPEKPTEPTDPVEPDPEKPTPENPDPEKPDPENPTDPSEPENPENPNTHQHAWTTEWASDAAHHWHECSAENCSIASNSDKQGYAEHTFGGWIVYIEPTILRNGSKLRDCTVCGYRETESIPALDGSEGNYYPSYPGNSGGSGSSGKPNNNSNNSSTTKPTTTPETTPSQNDSSATTVIREDGTTITTTSNNGITKTEVKLSTTAVQSATRSGSPVILPIPAVQASTDLATAPTITVDFDQVYPAPIAIPVANLSAGTVMVLVKLDGSTMVVKTSVAHNGNLLAELPSMSTVKIVDNSKSFADVPTGNWAADAVAFVSSRELFAGTTATAFAPNEPMTRAMLMTVLARFDGLDTDGGATWYAKSVEWAAERGISDGANPNANITREQLATMLWRYMGSPMVETDLYAHGDANQISSYAETAMQWAVKTGIMNGFENGSLQPQGQATRAQVAQMLMNLIQHIALDSEK